MPNARAYYNEHDPFAAAWLRALIADGHIAPGEVDERSITEVTATELVGYTQCHFFAGIGVWSYTLRRAGWPDDRRVWTGSCPCQPFSTAGTGRGTADARHLWPEFARLIGQCRPPVVFGEQVASAAGRAWLDAVCADLEALDYACGAADLCAAGVGAAHIRQRLYWVADAVRAGRAAWWAVARGRSLAGGSATGGLAHPDRERREGEAVHLRQSAKWAEGALGEPRARGGCTVGRDSARHADAPHVHGIAADWLYCTDGRWRPVESGTSALVDGAPARVGRLRGYGNALHAATAQSFIEAYADTCGLTPHAVLTLTPTPED